MPDRVVSSSKLTAIANAIRTKAGTQSSMTLDEMPTAIANIPSGGGSTIDLTGFTGKTWFPEVLKHLDTSGMTNMARMLQGMLQLDEYGNPYLDVDLSSWDVSNVTSMTRMFASCYGLLSLDLDGWNTASCTSMQEMFSSAFNSGSTGKIWVPSTFVATGVRYGYQKPFSDIGSPNTTVDVYTNATDAATQGWGTIDTSHFVMHYNTTHQDFLNA